MTFEDLFCRQLTTNKEMCKRHQQVDHLFSISFNELYYCLQSVNCFIYEDKCLFLFFLAVEYIYTHGDTAVFMWFRIIRKMRSMCQERSMLSENVLPINLNNSWCCLWKMTLIECLMCLKIWLMNLWCRIEIKPAHSKGLEFFLHMYILSLTDSSSNIWERK